MGIVKFVVPKGSIEEATFKIIEQVGREVLVEGAGYTELKYLTRI